MQVMRLLLIFVACVAIAQRSDVALSPDFKGDDIVKFFESSAAPKSEFETTAQYEARRGATRKTGKHLVLLIDYGRKPTFKYDADAGVMTATISISTVHFLLEPNRPTHDVIKVRSVVRKKDEYIGQNAYGASSRIDRTWSDGYGVILSQSLNRTLTFPLDTRAAQETKPYLHLGFSCTVASDTPLKDILSHKPTVSEPWEMVAIENYIPVTISEFFVFDVRSGIALLRFHPDDPADVAAQNQIRRKAFPLELEITNPSLLSVQADDGGEEKVYESNAVIRARQRIRLKSTMEPRYSRFSFKLNGSPYLPRWQVHNKNIGSYAMFDYAEALITTESQQPVTALGPHKVGATYWEWFQHIGIDQKALCKTNKSLCKVLSNIEKNGNGVFYTYDSSGRTIAWTFADHKVIGITPQ